MVSIGSTFRSGSIIDALDRTYFEELKEQIRIADYLDDRGINTMIETPGHIDAGNLLKLSDELKKIPYPIMPLGPMLTDIGFEEDDTVGAIGASLMGIHGCADVLSIVTSREHLSGIPDMEEMKKAISKYKIAKHIIDLYKTNDNSMDLKVSKQRALLRSCNIIPGQDCQRCGDNCPLRCL